MNPNKNTHIVHAGDTRFLAASLNYQKLQSQDMITWKKKAYSKEEVQENPLRLLFAIEDNGDIHYFGKDLSTNYKFTKQDVGKYIKFYSYCNNFNTLAQCIVFYVEGEHDTGVRITGVERIDSDSKESHVGEKIKLRTKFSLAEDRVSSKTREYVKWMVRIGGEEERLIIDGLVMTGREIDFDVPEDWVGKEVFFMPYLNKHTEEIICDIKVFPSEIIIVVGTEQHSQTYGNKLMFPAQAVREIRENHPTHKHVNILIFKDAYTPMQLSVIKRDAKRWNNTVYFKQINSTTELINYINDGDATINREMKVLMIKIFAHGLPNVLDFGLDGKNENIQQFTESHICQLKKESFVQNPIIYSYACRTGNSDSRKVASTPGYKYDKSWKSLVKPEDSIAQKLSNHLNAIVYAYLRRSNYSPTWDDKGDVEYKNKYLTIEDESVSNPLNPADWYRAYKNKWDEALWNINGAYTPPKAGNTPGGELPKDIYVFEKGKTPIAK